MLGGWGMPGSGGRGLGGPLRPRGTMPGVFGYPRVVAGDRVVAQSLCGGTDWAALTSRAEGAGHRRIGASLGVPAATVRAGYDGRLIGSR
ncbi:hypothetical protein I553_9249 [Mycobacterium xenopi 4042]|uniref:Uncharacterized protein n=1 Tax=Mycobacterium xenopi 4042 TaxID=1299334 RepID=X8AAV5_MYCXE|nr:hypothetical protein I553_9249 [Mycobacterium xenopi 4042]